MQSLRYYIDLVEHGMPASKRANLDKWVRETLSGAGIQANVVNGTVYVDTEQEIDPAIAALRSNAYLPDIPVRVSPKQAPGFTGYSANQFHRRPVDRR